MSPWAGGSCRRFGTTTPAVRLLLGVVPQNGATPRQNRIWLTTSSSDRARKS